MFVIENVPAPKDILGNAPRKGGRRSLYPFGDLAVGQSFVVPPPRVHAAAVAASYYKSCNPGWDYTRHQEGDAVRFYRIA